MIRYSQTIILTFIFISTFGFNYEGYGSESFDYSVFNTADTIYVTNLDKAGDGSFLEAISTDTVRVIMFNVSGTIRLIDGVHINANNCAIIGNGEVTLIGGTLLIDSGNVIIDNLKIRSGDIDSDIYSGERDCLSIKSTATNVIINNCSFSWSVDGVLDIEGQNITISNCIISEALDDSIHPQGAHSGGMLITGSGTNISLIRNLFACNRSRNPLVSANTRIEFINNVIYDGISRNFDLRSNGLYGNIEASIKGNYARSGINKQQSDPGSRYIAEVVDSLDILYVYIEGNFADSTDQILDENNQTIIYLETDTISTASSYLIYTQAYDTVLLTAGAFPRDLIDSNVVNGVINQDIGYIDSQEDVGGFLPEYESDNSYLYVKDIYNYDRLIDSINTYNDYPRNDADTYCLGSENSSKEYQIEIDNVIKKYLE